MVLGLRLLMRTPPRKIRKKYTAYYCAVTMLNYLSYIPLGFVFGSTFLTLIVALGVIPSHIFFLKYFEELELELRFGESYLEYKKTVPFLIPSFKWTS